MIRLVEALGYRALRYVSQPVDKFHVLVGPNASGKTTFLDAVALLSDVLRLGPAGAVEERAPEVGQLTFLRKGRRFEVAVELEIPETLRERLPNGSTSRCRYEVGLGSGEKHETVLLAETLWLRPPEGTPTEEGPRQTVLFPSPFEPPESIVVAPGRKAPKGWKKVVNKVTESGNDYFQSETSGWNNLFRLGPTKSALANLPEDETKFPVATWLKRTLMEGVKRIALSSDAMRRPGKPGAPRAFLPDGSNLPWVVDTLPAPRMTRWVKHLRTALPDLVAVKTIERPEDRHRYLVLVYEGGLEVPSWLVSDGTLRMLALTVLAYLPDLEGVFLVEEPENGIHPRAIESVYQSLSSVYGAQVLCASHSPVVLGLARPADLLCFAKVDGATDIVRGDEHPRLRNWQGGVDLGTLFAAGVLG